MMTCCFSTGNCFVSVCMRRNAVCGVLRFASPERYALGTLCPWNAMPSECICVFRRHFTSFSSV